MQFILKGTIVFEAEGLEDALFKLANHFLKIADGEESDLLLPGSDVSINQAVYDYPVVTTAEAAIATLRLGSGVGLDLTSLPKGEREFLSRQLHNIFTAGMRDIDIADSI